MLVVVQYNKVKVSSRRYLLSCLCCLRDNKKLIIGSISNDSATCHVYPSVQLRQVASTVTPSTTTSALYST